MNPIIKMMRLKNDRDELNRSTITRATGMTMKELNVAIDIFSGCGGLSLGMEEAGFHVKLAIDKWEPAIETYNYNREEKVGIVMDISSLTGDFIKEKCGVNEIPLVGGGPPCPGYSLAGKRNVMDPRNLMVDEYFRIIDEVKPRYFLMENVIGMESMFRPDGKILVMEWIDDKIREIGYQYKWRELFATSYGVAQKRKRLILVGWRNDMRVPLFPPIPTHKKYAFTSLIGHQIKPFVTVRDAFKKIPVDAPNQDLVYEFKREDYIEKVKKLKPGESVYKGYKESHRKLKWDEPSFTMKENHGSIGIHPEEIRMINLREMATLQDFPVDYEFIGDNRDIAVMIGNAVPPGLAKAVITEIYKVNEQCKR